MEAVCRLFRSGGLTANDLDLKSKIASLGQTLFARAVCSVQYRIKRRVPGPHRLLSGHPINKIPGVSAWYN
jgi:hypothetical protein